MSHRIAFVLALLAGAQAWAGSEGRSSSESGGSSGTRGGGEVVVFPDGGIVNADRYVRSPGRRWEIPADVRTELQRAGYILAQYGAEPDDVLDGSWYSPPKRYAKFIMDTVLNRRVRYIMAPFLPPSVPECATPTVSVQDGTVELVACTDGWVTWLREDLFLRLSPRAQAAKLVHEGLHRLPDNPSHEVMQEMTAGLELAMRLHHEQADEGKMPILSETPEGDDPYSEVEMIANLFHGMRNLGLIKNWSMAQFPDDWMIWPRGGALVSRRATLAWDAYAGVTTVLPTGSSLHQGAKVINSFCMGRGGWPCAIELGERAELRNTSFTNVVYDRISIGGNSVINGSSVQMTLSRNEPFQISTQSRAFRIGDNVRADRLWIMGMPGSVSIGDGARIDQGIFWVSTNLITYPPNLPHTPVSLAIGDRAVLKEVRPYVEGPPHWEMSDRGRFVPVLEFPAGSTVDLSSNPRALDGCTIKVHHDQRKVAARSARELITAACGRGGEG